MRARAVRWGARGTVLGLGILWWWAAARLLLVPDAGALEVTVAAGGWGLSLLPVHCMPKGRSEGALAAGRWRRLWDRKGDAGGDVGVTVADTPAAGTSETVSSPGAGPASSRDADPAA